MMQTCWICHMPVDERCGETLHIRGAAGDFAQTVSVCPAKTHACYERAVEAIENDGDRVGRAPSVAEAGRRALA